MSRVQGFLEVGTVDRVHGERRVNMDRLYQNGGLRLGPALISYDVICCGPPVEWVVVDQRLASLMAKCKVLYVEEDDLNDGSDSDDSQEGYLPRTRGRRVHYIPAETITMGSHGVTLKPDVPAAPAFSFNDWETEYAEFDAEFGPGMQTTGPRKLRESDDPHGQWA
ncbi:hypothetical protein B0H14DRAFT_3477597 [Mycena olivaceomarginata]|nr:hypothetical protein B0H14DRAFT_3477597 [Mycena olivaceomarginata]